MAVYVLEIQQSLNMSVGRYVCMYVCTYIHRYESGMYSKSTYRLVCTKSEFLGTGC